MDDLLSPSRAGKHATVRSSSSSGGVKDLWSVVKQGSTGELNLALICSKKTGVNIDARNSAGLTPLHIATRRNHVPILRRLIDAGADPDARDVESGWSSLHWALHFGHLSVAGILLQSGASITLEDLKGQTPVDFLSGPISQVSECPSKQAVTELFSWGSGTNYQLGTGNVHIQKLPCKVDALHDSHVKIIAAAKFHSIAVGSDGELYTWGYGRGGRLGHPDFDIHSGQAAVITPCQVTAGLSLRRVKAVAAAKHHTVVATEFGEVYTWGSNREGQLGYTSVDTQPTPRRVNSLKGKVVSVAAANKHSAAVLDSGEIYTWGCNKEGQLGYGTSNSASNCFPRVVVCLKGKVFVGISAAKYHTIVLSADGEVYTWGHRLVTPRRVIVARSLKKCGSAPLKFHRSEWLCVISVAAGVVHSTALTDDGALFFWNSSDPDLKSQELYSLSKRKVVSISAGKYWTAAVTTTGDVFMWDAKKGKEEIPAITRVHGVKRATAVCVGETHLMVLCSLYHPVSPTQPSQSGSSGKQTARIDDEFEELDEDVLFDDVPIANCDLIAMDNEICSKCAPSLKALCQEVAVKFVLEPRNAVQLLEIADSLQAEDLKRHCEDVAVRNLDYIFTVAPLSIASAPLEVLVKLENLLDERSSEPWSRRRLSMVTATFPAVINSDGEEESRRELLRMGDKHMPVPEGSITDSFLQNDRVVDQAVFKQVRALRKKLQQIEMLEARMSSGRNLDDQQIAKLETRFALEDALVELGFPYEREKGLSSAGLSDGKVGRRPEVTKKQRRKNRKHHQTVELDKASDCKEEVEASSPTVSDATPHLVGKDESKPCEKAIAVDGSKDVSSSLTNKGSRQVVAKKKSKKGGLSLFLSGALDHTPKPIPPPPVTPKHEGPAWGGAKISKGLASLRDIQNEQSQMKEQTTKAKCQPDGSMALKSSKQVGNQTSPIPVVPARAVPFSEGTTVPWSSAGSSPSTSRPSFRDIQMQQEKKHHGNSHSPTVRTSGFSVPPPDVPNRWFVPETDAPSTIRAIQIEEQAMKDLKRFYSSVKILKPQQQL